MGSNLQHHGRGGLSCTLHVRCVRRIVSADRSSRLGCRVQLQHGSRSASSAWPGASAAYGAHGAAGPGSGHLTAYSGPG